MIRMNIVAVMQLGMTLGSLILFILLQGQFSFLKKFFGRSPKYVFVAEIVLGLIGAYGSYSLFVDLFGERNNIDIVGLDSRIASLESEKRVFIPDTGDPNDPDRAEDLLERYRVGPADYEHYELLRPTAIAYSPLDSMSDRTECWIFHTEVSLQVADYMDAQLQYSFNGIDWIPSFTQVRPRICSPDAKDIVLVRLYSRNGRSVGPFPYPFDFVSEKAKTEPYRRPDAGGQQTYGKG